MVKESIKKLSVANDFFADAIPQFQAILSLKSGWDSQGSDPPSQLTIQSGFNILCLLKQIDSRLIKPHINPTRSGGIQFHWESKDFYYFEIEVISDNEVQIYFTDYKNEIEYRLINLIYNKLKDIIEPILEKIENI